jgi:hypothetical protein
MAKNETATPSNVSLPIPKILRMSLVGKGQMAGRIGTSFKPPSSMRDWPATIRDIDDSFLKKVINIGYRSGPAPVGSIYDPLPFNSKANQDKLRSKAMFTLTIFHFGFRLQKPRAFIILFMVLFYTSVRTLDPN